MSRTVYKLGVTKQAVTLAEHGPGIETGHVRWEGGKKYILLQAVTADLADGKVCKKDTTSSATYTVVVGAAAGDLCIGVNNTGAAITTGNYFWALQEGRGYSIGSTFADGVSLSPGAAGVVAASATTTTPVGIGITDNTVVHWTMPGGLYNL